MASLKAKAMNIIKMVSPGMLVDIVKESIMEKIVYCIMKMG